METTVGGVESLVVKYHVSPSKEDFKGLPARSVISSNLSLTLCSFPDPRPFEALKTPLVEVVVIAPSICSPPMETINVAELILPCSIASENVTLTSEFSSTSESLFPGFMEDKFGESKSMEVKSMFTSSSVSTPSFPPSLVSSFKEKPQVTIGRINGGFFVTDKRFFNFIKNEKTILEREPLEKTSRKKQLSAYIHDGFWKCMDTKRDKDELEILDKNMKIKPWLNFKDE